MGSYDGCDDEDSSSLRQSLCAPGRERSSAPGAGERLSRTESREMSDLHGDPRNLILQLSAGRLVVFGKKLSRFYGNHYRQKHAVGELE